MSYSCYISFKKIPAQEIQEFFVTMKNKVKETADEIAKQDFRYSPASRAINSKNLCDWGDCPIDLRNSQEYWVNKIFCYRWFYLKEQETLCIFGVPNSLYNLFDTTIYFQNSTDQDYEFETWKELEFLTPLIEKCKTLTPEQINRIQGDDDLKYYIDHLDYYRKSLCYQEIWNTYFDKMLYDDGKAIYISLFSLGFDDFYFRVNFAKKCFDLWVDDYRKWLEEKPNGN